MKRKLYEKELRKLQVELCQVQDWVKAKGSALSSFSKAATLRAKVEQSKRSPKE